MNRILYPKLALTNIRKNYQTYVPFILTSIFMVMLNYIIGSLASNPSNQLIRGARSANAFLRLGVLVIAIFAVIFLLYTSSFLIKRRKKEFGLYAILGMEKKHIARVLSYEMVTVYVLSMVVGLLLGITFDKLVFMFLLNLVSEKVPLGFHFSLDSLTSSLLLFSIIFAVILVWSISQVYINQPILLFKGSNVGEKEPKARWIATIIGVGCIGFAYYIAQTFQNPLQAFSDFFIAVVLVIIGTYLLFMSGSITLLKALKKNRKFFYKPNNFISISSMLYRMKQNAAGLASICILSTMVLVMLSTTTALYVAVEETINMHSTKNINTIIFLDEKDLSCIEVIKGEISKVLQKNDAEISSEYGYTYLDLPGVLENGEFVLEIETESSDYLYTISFITLSDYRLLTNSTVELEKNEVLIGSEDGESIGDSIRVNDKEYKIIGNVEKFETYGSSFMNISPTLYVIVSDLDVIFEIFDYQKSKYPEDYYFKIAHYYGFDLANEKDREKTEAIVAEFLEEIYTFNDDTGTISAGFGILPNIAETSADVRGMYGGLLFLGLFLGTIFIMGTTLIIYYKQVTEGHEDMGRYEIMQKVGMGKNEVRKTINAQVLQVFFLPLIVAIIHMLMGYRIIRKFMELVFFDTSIAFVVSTVGTITIFTIFYILIYLLTARVYYKIVSS